MSKIVANIVGRNEADKYLHRILTRLQPQVDLICFTDDASDDDTAQIAADYGCIVQRMSEPTFRTNEGKLRQASWEHLEQSIGEERDWFVLAIDCDEELYETHHSLRELTNQNMFDVLNVEFFHMWNETQFRVDKAWTPHPSTRLFRFLENGVFQNRQLACGSEPTYVQTLFRQGRYLPSTGLVMKHLSYMTDAGKKEKYDRYTAIDGGAFHANAHIESIMDPAPQLMDWNFG